MIRMKIVGDVVCFSARSSHPAQSANYVPTGSAVNPMHDPHHGAQPDAHRSGAQQAHNDAWGWGLSQQARTPPVIYCLFPLRITQRVSSTPAGITRTRWFSKGWRKPACRYVLSSVTRSFYVGRGSYVQIGMWGRKCTCPTGAMIGMLSVGFGTGTNDVRGIKLGCDVGGIKLGRDKIVQLVARRLGLEGQLVGGGSLLEQKTTAKTSALTISAAARPVDEASRQSSSTTSTSKVFPPTKVGGKESDGAGRTQNVAPPGGRTDGGTDTGSAPSESASTGAAPSESASTGGARAAPSEGASTGGAAPSESASTGGAAPSESTMISGGGAEEALAARAELADKTLSEPSSPELHAAKAAHEKIMSVTETIRKEVRKKGAKVRTEEGPTNGGVKSSSSLDESFTTTSSREDEDFARHDEATARPRSATAAGAPSDLLERSSHLGVHVIPEKAKRPQAVNPMVDPML